MKKENQRNICIATCMLLAFLLYKFSLPKQVIGIGVTAVYIVSTFIGGFLLGKHMKVKKFLWGMVLGIGYFAVLFLVSLVVENSVQTSSSGIFLTLVLCAVSGMFGGMLS